MTLLSLLIQSVFNVFILVHFAFTSRIGVFYAIFAPRYNVVGSLVAEESVFEVTESYDHHGNVIKRSP